MAKIVLRGVAKRFGEVVAVDHIDLEVPDGKILTLLGPSGCGKSTTLRMVAGFEQPDEGEIVLDGQVINTMPPERRPTSMVFQNYALWPHKTVYGNIAFGLRVRKLPKDQIRLKAQEMLHLVNLEEFGDRYPRQLSGGQRQRVALARSLAVEPSILLLDEPLSNLDAKLRVRMRSEIKDLQRRVGITMLYVTHDQEEALSLSDYIAVMNQGRIEQVGTPLEIYKYPASEFVAFFIGQTNFLRGMVEESSSGRVVVRVGKSRLEATTRADLETGQKVVLAIKAEAIQLTDSPGYNTLQGFFHMPSYLGATTRWEVKTEGETLSLDVSGYRLPSSPEAGLNLHMPVAELIAFPENRNQL
jgi:ABC-type Fe3+/spermidine/putrescine transport system ATPase subunit